MFYIWKYFIDIDRQRTNNGYSVLPLQYSEILAYFNIYRIEIDPFEIDAILQLDMVFVKHHLDEQEKNMKKTTGKK